MSPAPTSSPATLLPLSRPLMTGEVLDAAFRLFRAGLLRTLPYSGLAVLVFELPTLYSALGGAPQPLTWTANKLNDTHVVFLCAVLVSVFLVGVLMLRLHALSRGERPRFRTEIRVALRRFPGALLATFGALGFPLALYAFTRVLGGMFPSELALFLALPLLWPTALFIMALPAFWCAQLGPLAAIARAVRVARRRLWRTVGALLACLCLVAVFYILAAMLGAMIASMLSYADLFLIAIVGSLMTLVVGAFGLPFAIALLVVAYADLEVRRAERA